MIGLPCLVTFITDLKTRRVGLSASAELLVIDRRHQGGKMSGVEGLNLPTSDSPSSPFTMYPGGWLY